MPPKPSEPKGKGEKRPPDPGGTHPKTRAGSKQQTAPATATVDLTTVKPTQEAEAKSKGKEVAEVEVEDKSESEGEDEEDEEILAAVEADRARRSGVASPQEGASFDDELNLSSPVKVPSGYAGTSTSARSGGNTMEAANMDVLVSRQVVQSIMRGIDDPQTRVEAALAATTMLVGGVRVPRPIEPVKAPSYLEFPETPVKPRATPPYGDMPRLPSLEGMFLKGDKPNPNPPEAAGLDQSIHAAVGQFQRDEERYNFSEERPGEISAALRGLARWFREGSAANLSRQDKGRIGDDVLFFSTSIRMADHWAKRDLSGGNNTGLTLEQSLASIYKSVELPPTPQREKGALA